MTKTLEIHFISLEHYVIRYSDFCLNETFRSGTRYWMLDAGFFLVILRGFTYIYDLSPQW